MFLLSQNSDFFVVADLWVLMNVCMSVLWSEWPKQIRSVDFSGEVEMYESF